MWFNKTVSSHIPGWSLSGSADQCRLGRPECCCLWKSWAGPWSSLWRQRPGLLQSAPGRRWYPGTQRTEKVETFTAVWNSKGTQKKQAWSSKTTRWRTNLSRKEFSRSAPMQPANPRMNITPPTTKKSHTGSKPPRSVMDEMLERTP